MPDGISPIQAQTWLMDTRAVQPRGAQAHPGGHGTLVTGPSTEGTPWQMALRAYPGVPVEHVGILRAQIERDNPGLSLDDPLPSGRIFLLSAPERVAAALIGAPPAPSALRAEDSAAPATTAALTPPSSDGVSAAGSCSVDRAVLGANPVPGIYTGDSFTPNRAVLTFDDGPHGTNTPQILDALQAHGATATFFVNGRTINPNTFALIQRMVAEGHTLGNHTYGHDASAARGVPRSSGGRRSSGTQAYIEAQYQLCQAMVDMAMLARDGDDFRALRTRLLGQSRLSNEEVAMDWPQIATRWQAILDERSDGQSPYRMVHSRPPGGNPYWRSFRDSHRQVFSAALNNLGLVNDLWTGSSGDSDGSLSRTERFRQERLVGNVMRGVREGGVILMHDRIPPRAVRGFLEEMARDERYQVISMDDAMQQKYDCSTDEVLRQAADE